MEANRRTNGGMHGEAGQTAVMLLEATIRCLNTHGMAALSTRKVADEAGVPLSQIHYHFGSKRGLLLGVLEYRNRQLLERQSRMYGAEWPLSERWDQACDFLEEDIESGYVRVLQEIIAAGWSDPDIAQEGRRIVGAWYALLTQVSEEAVHQLGGLGPFTGAEAAVIAGHLFLGAESAILLGFSEAEMPTRGALRKVGDLLRNLEELNSGGNDHAG